MNAVRYCFLHLAPLFRKIANMHVFHRERLNQENTYTLFILREFCSKVKPKEER